ncbi:hypothetical protein [Streptomyces mirabilis]|uniref:hypothetical protein n=1 Tax=Streptomyces mirabilis TaxID=68239 RepID=UPI0036518691
MAGVNTVNAWVTMGRWGPTATTAARQAAAEALPLDGGVAFVDDKPGQLVGVREVITR